MRRILILLVLIGILLVIGVSAFYVDKVQMVSDRDEVSDLARSEQVASEQMRSEVASSEQIRSEAESSEVPKYDANGDLVENSKYLDDDNDTVSNYYDICLGIDDFSDECDTSKYVTSKPVEEVNTEPKYDANGSLVENSTYLDDDGDTIANYYDICPGVDDLSDGCDTSKYVTNKPVEEVEEKSEYDANGSLVENSTYLDDDGDTIANYYDICPGVDDLSDDCDTSAYTNS